MGQPVDGGDSLALAVLQVSEGLVLCDAVLLAVASAGVIITKESKIVLKDVDHLVLLQSLITPERPQQVSAERLPHDCTTAFTRCAG